MTKWLAPQPDPPPARWLDPVSGLPLDRLLGHDTPQRPLPAAGGRPLAHWGWRFGAAVVELGVAFAAAMVAAAFFIADGGDPVVDEDRGWIVGACVLLLVTGGWALVFPGRTLGKAIAGVRVVDADGSPIGRGRSVLREGVGRLLWALPIVAIVDGLLPLRADRRGLRDRMARTAVVQDGGTAWRANALAWAATIAIVGSIVAVEVEDGVYREHDFVAFCRSLGETKVVCQCAYERFDERATEVQKDDFFYGGRVPDEVMFFIDRQRRACRRDLPVGEHARRDISRAYATPQEVAFALMPRAWDAARHGCRGHPRVRAGQRL